MADLIVILVLILMGCGAYRQLRTKGSCGCGQSGCQACSKSQCGSCTEKK